MSYLRLDLDKGRWIVRVAHKAINFWAVVLTITLVWTTLTFKPFSFFSARWSLSLLKLFWHLWYLVRMAHKAHRSLSPCSICCQSVWFVANIILIPCSTEKRFILTLTIAWKLAIVYPSCHVEMIWCVIHHAKRTVAIGIVSLLPYWISHLGIIIFMSYWWVSYIAHARLEQPYTFYNSSTLLQQLMDINWFWSWHTSLRLLQRCLKCYFLRQRMEDILLSLARYILLHLGLWFPKICSTLNQLQSRRTSIIWRLNLRRNVIIWSILYRLGCLKVLHGLSHKLAPLLFCHHKLLNLHHLHFLRLSYLFRLIKVSLYQLSIGNPTIALLKLWFQTRWQIVWPWSLLVEEGDENASLEGLNEFSRKRLLEYIWHFIVLFSTHDDFLHVLCY